MSLVRKGRPPALRCWRLLPPTRGGIGPLPTAPTGKAPRPIATRAPARRPFVGGGGASVRRTGAAALLAFAMLLAECVLPGGESVAQAEVLVANTGQSDDAGKCIHNTHSRAQAFRTGADVYGYDLENIVMHVEDAPNDWDDVTVRLAKGPPRAPGGTLNSGLITTLVNPASGAPNFGRGQRTWTLPSGTSVVLLPQTQYTVEIGHDSDTDCDFKIDSTNSDSEDSNSNTGWSIDNSHRHTAAAGNAGSFLFNQSDAAALRIKVNGSAATDTTAPTLKSASVVERVTLNFDEELDEDSKPNTSAFTVWVDGVEREVSAVSIVAKDVTLTLQSAVEFGQTVTVSYTPPTANPLRDAAVNEVAAFMNEPVRNELREGGVCDRTEQIKAELVRVSGVSTCTFVTNRMLAAISSLDLSNKSIETLMTGDFEGLTSLSFLNLSSNEIETLTANDLDGLTALEYLDLKNNELSIEGLPNNGFNWLASGIRELWLSGNPGCPSHGNSCFPPTPVINVGEGTPEELVVRSGETVTMTVDIGDYVHPLGRSLKRTWTQKSGEPTGVSGRGITRTFTVPEVVEEKKAQFSVTIEAGGAGRWTAQILGRLFASMTVESQEMTFVPQTVQAPPAPRLTAQGGPRRIDLSWSGKTGGSDITGYRVEVSIDGTDGSWTDLVESTTETTYSHTGLSATARRYYRVSATNVIGTGPTSGVVSATPAAQPVDTSGGATAFGTEVWKATLTTAAFQDSSGTIDFKGFSENLSEGMLDPAGFRIPQRFEVPEGTLIPPGTEFGDIPFAFSAITWQDSSNPDFPNTLRLVLKINGTPCSPFLQDNPANVFVDWAFHVGARKFWFADLEPTGAGGLCFATYHWDNVELPWTGGETVEVRITSRETGAYPDLLPVQDAEVQESGDGTTRDMTFTVSVDLEPDFDVGVHYRTKPVGTTTEGDEDDVCPTDRPTMSGEDAPDYIAESGRLTFGPGRELSQEVVVTVCDDNIVDSGEEFLLVLNSTQLHESIEDIEVRGSIREYGEDEETGSATGTITNDESTTVVSIAADAAYVEEGTEAGFTLRRTGEAEEALTVPVSVVEDGSALATPVPESATFAAGSRQAELRVATADDDAVETDSAVTATLEAGFNWQLAEGADSASVTVLDNDAAAVTSTSSAEVTVWSADMTVVEYGPRSIGAGTADLFSNQRGSAGLAAKWLWYDPSGRKLKIAFDDGLDDAGSLTLHLGDLSVGFPADSGGDSSFTLEEVDVSWTAGETLAARVSKPSAEAVSTDATLASLTVSGATLSPDFDPGVLVYRAAVDAETETVTVKASTADGGASVAYGPSEDADTALADHQVAAPEGETLVAVTVTAADGTVRRYRVVVARAAAGANAAPAGLPAISGTPRVGEELTASAAAITDADGTGNATFAWQWLANDGATEAAVAGATASTYTVAPADAGRTLKVRVTFTDDKGTEEVLTSAATDTVVDPRPVAATLSVGAGAAEAGRFRLRIAFGDAVTGLAPADVTASQVGGGAAAVSALAQVETGRAWTAWVAAEAGRYTVWLAAGAAQAGERRSLAAVLAVDVDADGNATAVAGPVVTAVALEAAPDGTWTAGETVRLSLTFSEPVTVATGGGTPTVGIALDGTARQASYASGSGRVAVFTYAVTADDGTVTAVSLTADSLAMNGGTIRDAAGRDADLEHPGLGEATEETESAPALTGLKLVNTASGTETALADGDALVLDDPANGSWGLVAAVAAEAQVGSVRLVLKGANTVTAATDDAAPYSLHGDEDGTVAGEGLPAGSYTLKATAYRQAAGAGAKLGTLSVSFTVAASEAVAPDALTASFEGVPEAHGGPGSEAFTFRVRFSEEPRVSYAVLRDESFAVTGGGVRKARRVDGRNDLREIHIEPKGWDDVTVMLAGGRACGTEGAICTADGKVLANTAVARVPGPLALSVADARVDEAPGAVLAFAVTLNRAASGTVTVDYATSDGTATAGADYTAASGTLTFAPGETAKTVNVPVLDDAHDDGGETLTLTLSNASGARIRDGEATGTIENSDAIPKAWLARFGRTVADHVVDAIGERLEGSSGGGSQVTLGGQAIPLDGSAGGAAPGAAPAAGDEEAAARGALTALADRIGGSADGGARERGSGDARFADGWTREGASATEHSLTGRELLLGSSFVLNLSGDGEDGAGAPGTRWTAWGRASSSRFDGEADGLVLDGDVTTFTLGADAAQGGWLAGVAVALSEGTGGFRDHDDTGDRNHPDRGSGTLESTLTSVHPYARLEVSERLSLWGLLGYGTGELDVEVDGVGRWSTDTTQEMAAAGARGVLVKAPETGGFELGLRGDAVVQRMRSDAATGEAGNLAGADARTSRLRLTLEGSRAVALEDGGRFVPSLEVGLRRDGGDAETGTGIELGGGLAWTDPARGLTVEAKARTLIAHEDGDYREWGASGSVRIEPGASGRGLSLTLAPAWGAAEGGAERLWGLRDARGLAPDAEAPAGSRLEAELGYGFAVFGDRGVATPYAGLSRSETGETLRLGQSLRLGASQWKVESAFGEAERTYTAGYGYRLRGDFELGVDATRREAANDDAAEHEIMLRLGARW